MEAMGAEFYAHFEVDSKQIAHTRQDDVFAETGDVGELTGTGGTVLVARLSAKSSARSGDEALARRELDALLRRR